MKNLDLKKEKIDLKKVENPDLDPKKVQDEINTANKQQLEKHGEAITLLQTVSLGVILALLLGLISAIQGFNAMRIEADQFKSQTFLDLIKTTQDTNAKINALVK
ncbi:MAG: hypothetical protein WC447_03165 [Candidatus Paceibacterota bacterium]|jgi:hypothetical protein